MDLWLDGYKAGIPEKKVSIYNRGALISLCLDVMLIGKGSSIEAVMKEMWLKFGQLSKGYTLDDFENIISQHVTDAALIREFFNSYIYGVKDILPSLVEHLGFVEILLETGPRENEMESDFGLLINPENTLSKIHPECPPTNCYL